VPGVSKKDILIEAGDNDITIECTFTPFIEEFDEEDEAEVIVSAIKYGRCVKTVRFENSIDIENIKAKFKNGTVRITLPKLIIPKHKIKVD
jgi:HSP20 family protein